MSFSRILIAIFIIACLAALAFGAYTLVAQKYDNERMWSPVPSATSTDAMASSSPFSYPPPSATTTVPSSWKNYSNNGLGYRISYPPDLLVNASGPALTLAFPKTAYFKWPLQDDAKITITAATSCPPLQTENLSATTTFTLNGYSFARLEGHGVAAGNLYNEWAYQTSANGLCYQIDLFDHGANGAGLYVDDQSLIRSYDDRHTADLDAVMGVWNAVTASFRAHLPN